MSAFQFLSNPFEIFLVFLRLGLTSFGGPIAHLGYFHEEFVTRRRWLNEQSYTDLVAFCQFLPGPASSQFGMAIGFMRGGYLGAFLAWLGFTMPSAILLMLFAVGISSDAHLFDSRLLHGLKVVAVAVVAQAVWQMAQKSCAGLPKIAMMTGVCACVLLWPAAWIQVAMIGLAALLGTLFFRSQDTMTDREPLPIPMRRKTGMAFLCVFAILLIGLPLLAHWSSNSNLAAVDSFYRTGSLVFGGGHVVLPLLEQEVVTPGWVNHETFLAGYGAAQAVPGPLFTFSAYLGASMSFFANPFLGGVICLVAIFAPSFLLILGALPFWETLRRHPGMQSALSGINAAVVGLLLAALYQPVWTSAIHGPKDFVLGLLCWTGLVFGRFPPWLVVLTGATGGFLISYI